MVTSGNRAPNRTVLTSRCTHGTKNEKKLWHSSCTYHKPKKHWKKLWLLMACSRKSKNLEMTLFPQSPGNIRAGLILWMIYSQLNQLTVRCWGKQKINSSMAENPACIPKFIHLQSCENVEEQNKQYLLSSRKCPTEQTIFQFQNLMVMQLLFHPEKVSMNHHQATHEEKGKIVEFLC